MSAIASFADYFVIATATSARQMDALIDGLRQALGAKGVSPARQEGTPDSGWVLIDYGDVVVHLFSQESRDYYRLEQVWSGGVPLVRIQ
ncbi:MAG TPA: ribosome silencing factor [Dehalococcoidia bacterium]|nr:ribosome silencing factor [Dehalococcoidia bacterium]